MGGFCCGLRGLVRPKHSVGSLQSVVSFVLFTACVCFIVVPGFRKAPDGFFLCGETRAIKGSKSYVDLT